MKVCVVGTGYVGLVAGTGFAEFGNDVRCVDLDTKRIASLREGKSPIHEPGLDELLRRTIESGRLSFTASLEEAAPEAEVVFLAVGTPSREDGSCDTSQIELVAESLAKLVKRPTVVAIKSTVPVGSNERVQKIFDKAGVDVSVASNPEFLTEGNAVNDFMKPARILLGVRDDRSKKALRSLYAPFVRTIDRIIVVDPKSAEMCKYACNAFLATRISFMNELARLCERVGADVEAVRQGMVWDERIGPRYLFPGAGFGGSCLPKDVSALLALAKDHDFSLRIPQAAYDINQDQRRLLGERVLAHFDGNIEGKVIGVWGLAFKPQTDDIRESPAIPLVEKLLEEKARVRAHDPVAAEAFSRLFGSRIEYVDRPYEAAEQADALVLVTEWHDFRRPDFKRLYEIMRDRVIVDGRNIWNPSELRDLGFSYYGIGRP